MSRRTGRGSRRAVLGASALAVGAIGAMAHAAARRPDMPPTIRRATARDIPAMVGVLLTDAEHRSRQDPAIWPLAADPSARIKSALERGLAGSAPAPQELWLLAETAGRLVGLTHAMIVPVPPVYGVAASPGLFLDDCFTIPDAPPETAEALLEATEAALRSAGAGDLIASHPAAGPWRPLYERHGFQPVTLYMAKHAFKARDLSSGLRNAAPEDVPGIVNLNADHRRTLAELNPRFWPLRPDAESRFKTWMSYSLTLKDRDMLVAGGPDDMHGYAIAQPISRLLMPAAHEIGAIGVIDDFYDRDFANVAALADDGATGAKLLSAAESAFARRGLGAALVVCPAAWTSKAELLRRQGYRTAKLWMFKTQTG
jgi:GNAT superfamily N-acetyltransferase